MEAYAIPKGANVTYKDDIYETGGFEGVKESYYHSLFEDRQLGLKQISVVCGLVSLASDLSEAIQEYSAPVFRGMISEAVSMASPICNIPEVVHLTFFAKKNLVRAYVTVITDFSTDSVSDALKITIKVAQRVADAVVGLIKLALVDVAFRSSAKLVKDGFSCIMDIQTIYSVSEMDKKAELELNQEIKALMKKKNNMMYLKGVMGLGLHATSFLALVLSIEVVAAATLLFGAATMASGMTAGYYATEEKNMVNEIAAKILNDRKYEGEELMKLFSADYAGKGLPIPRLADVDRDTATA